MLGVLTCKFFSSDEDFNYLSNEYVYSIIFGPDICGTVHKKTYIILNKGDKYYSYLKGVSCYKEHLTHIYTLIIRTNNTIEYKIEYQIKLPIFFLLSKKLIYIK